jgi:nitroreductase
MEKYWERHPEVIETIMQRRSIRKFLDDPISEDDILTILRAGHFAPNASNMQTWKFIAVTNRALNVEIADIVDQTYTAMASLVEDKEAKKNIKYARFYSRFFADSPLAVYCVGTPYESKTDEYYRMMGNAGQIYRENRASANSGLQSVSAAIENMLLAAWALGIGGVWMTAPVVARDKIETKLEINEGRLAAVIALGYPSTPPGEANRKPLEDVIRIIR